MGYVSNINNGGADAKEKCAIACHTGEYAGFIVNVADSVFFSNTPNPRCWCEVPHTDDCTIKQFETLSDNSILHKYNRWNYLNTLPEYNLPVSDSIEFTFVEPYVSVLNVNDRTTPDQIVYKPAIIVKYDDDMETIRSGTHYNHVIGEFDFYNMTKPFAKFDLTNGIVRYVDAAGSQICDVGPKVPITDFRWLPTGVSSEYNSNMDEDFILEEKKIKHWYVGGNFKSVTHRQPRTCGDLYFNNGELLGHSEFVDDSRHYYDPNGNLVGVISPTSSSNDYYDFDSDVNDNSLVIAVIAHNISVTFDGTDVAHRALST
jgi:hypothetical protein